jgi:type IV secretory pathway VirJ component
MLKEDFVKVFQLKGGHHFGGDYEAIAEIILKEMSQ